MLKRTPRILKILLGLAVLVLLAIGLYFIPPVHSRLEASARLTNLRNSVIYFFYPPQNVTFQPSGQSTLRSPPL
jgi:type II secretory pathway component PulM